MPEKKKRGPKVRWTKESCIQAMEAFWQRTGRRPHLEEMNSRSNMPTPQTFLLKVGYGYGQYCDEHGYYREVPFYKRSWNAELCKAAVDKFVQEKGRFPQISREANVQFGLPSQNIFHDHVGKTIGAYLKETYPEFANPQNVYTSRRSRPLWTKESIDAAADRFFQLHGRYPCYEEYDREHGLPSRNTFTSHFGMTVNEYWRRRYPIPPAWPPARIHAAFEQFIERHSRLPKRCELGRKNELPTWKELMDSTGAESYVHFCYDHFPHMSRRVWDKDMYMGILRSGETRSEIFHELQIITPEQFERVEAGRRQRAADYEAKCSAAWQKEIVLQDGSEVEVNRPPRACPKRNTGKSLLSGNVFCGHCGGRIFSSTARKNHHPTPDKPIERIIVYKCYNRTQHKQVCNSPSTYRAARVDQVVDSPLHGIFDRTKDIDEESFIKQQLQVSTQQYQQKNKKSESGLYKSLKRTCQMGGSHVGLNRRQLCLHTSADQAAYGYRPSNTG